MHFGKEGTAGPPGLTHVAAAAAGAAQTRRLQAGCDESAVERLGAVYAPVFGAAAYPPQLQRTLCPALLHLPCDPPFLTTAHKILQLTHTLYYALFREACKWVHDYVTLVLYFQCIQCSLHTISTLHFCPAAYFFRLGQLLAEKVHHYI